ncbi:MAG: superoxide dismutase, Fe-Mn family [Bacteroidetes bacterium]|nr:MAG: superoxide dismutase, Fe-Mn family [Bacteroidota bacterium]
MDNENNSRRDFLKKTALLTAGGIGLSLLGSNMAEAAGGIEKESKALAGDSPFTLPALPYSFDALEPAIDRQTMEIHHGKHHQAYVTNLNKAVADIKDAPGDIEALLKKYAKLSPAVRNNGGGHYNHSLFWKMMRPSYAATAANAPSGSLSDAIVSAFGSFDAFKEKFTAAGKDRFGSGWVWLVSQNGKLAIGSTPNQDNPLMEMSEIKGSPVLALDVWEHAYYLKYQNKRPDYMNAWWSVVNWEEAARLYSGGK